MVGSASIHASPSVRFHGAYFWCEKYTTGAVANLLHLSVGTRCACYTTGAVAKLLHAECQHTLRNAVAKHMHGRLCKGLTPLRKLLPVEGVEGEGRVLLASDDCGRHALQMYSP